MLTELTEKIYHTPGFEKIKAHNGINLFFNGLRGSLNSFAAAEIYSIHKKIVICSNDTGKLFRLRDDINIILGSDIASIYLTEFDEEYESEITSLSTTLKKLS